jgi:lysophospholipase L1-like esterase
VTRVALLLVLACLSVAFVACGGDDDGSILPLTESPVRTPTPTASATAPAQPTVAPSEIITRSPAPIAPGEDPQGDQLLYLALGDSLSEGIGAEDEKRDAWVPLVATGLGSSYELLNLGVAGDDSEELIEDGPLDHGLQEIAARANDGVPGNEVAVITLEIGGNDLLDLYDSLVLTGDCPTVIESLQRQECIDGLQGALDAFRPNLAHTIEALQSAAPGVPIFLMTLYNPFSGGARTLDEIGALALEGQAGTPFAEGLNDGIRAEAAAHPSVVLVEWYSLFLQKQSEYISQDLIHPNNVGHQVMADAVLGAMNAAGLP